MDKGYVYVARIIDHAGKFVNGYHKIGKTQQYKIRETQLNSTHLPFDVLFVRVFETNDMNQLEKVLHTCFDDYRVEKEYDYRRNITTEWFDVSDAENLNNKIDKLTNLLGGIEVDIVKKMEEDLTITSKDKGEITKAVRKNKPYKIRFTYKGEDLTQPTVKDSYILALTKIAEMVGWEDLDDREKHIATTLEEIGYGDYGQYVEVNGLVIWTNTSTHDKVKRVNKHLEYYGISDMEFCIVDE